MRTVNSIRSAVMGLAAALSLTLSAQVKMMNQPIPPNGDFSQGFWQDVPEQSGFVPLKSSGKTKPGAQTAFKVAADADNVYLNIRCYEPKMNELKKTDNPAGLWGSDLVEIFLCPTGQPDEYYQFAATAGNLHFNMFYGEAGVITPDPYSPFWESKVFYGKDYWQLRQTGNTRPAVRWDKGKSPPDRTTTAHPDCPFFSARSSVVHNSGCSDKYCRRPPRL